MDVVIAGVTAEDPRTADSGLNLILRSTNAVATAFTPEGDALPEQSLAGQRNAGKSTSPRPCGKHAQQTRFLI
jgi:hypothetical protein